MITPTSLRAFAHRREALWLAAFALLTIICTFTYIQSSNGRNLRATLGPRLSLLDLSNLDNSTLRRFTLSDINQHGLKSLGINDPKDPRLSKIHLSDLREKYLSRVDIEDLKSPILATLTVGDLRAPGWINTPAPAPRTVAPTAVASKPAAPPKKQSIPSMTITTLPNPKATPTPVVASKPPAKPPPKPVKRYRSPAPSRYIAGRPLPTRSYLHYRVYTPPKHPIAVERIYIPQRAPDFKKHKFKGFGKKLKRFFLEEVFGDD